MKTREELQEFMQAIKSDASPVGMDPVYVHALILDKLTSIERRLDRLEEFVDPACGPDKDEEDEE